MTQDRSIRIGSGSANELDHIFRTAKLVKQDDIDYLCCDRMSETTLNNAIKRKNDDPTKGYGRNLAEFFEQILPLAYEQDITIIGNFGQANPEAGGKKVAEIAAELELYDLDVCSITGNDVSDVYQNGGLTTDGPLTGQTDDPTALEGFVGAHVYSGLQPMVEALENDADVILNGRSSDAAMYAAPSVFEFDWAFDDWDKVATGHCVGHLLECGVHGTGGNIADPGYVNIPDLADLGPPIAEVSSDGEFFVTKPPDTGGKVSELTVTAQLLYEVEDPEHYYHPDVVANFKHASLEQVEENKVRVTGITGKPKPEKLKVNIIADGGFKGSIIMGWGGSNALEKAELQRTEMLEQRLDNINELLESDVEILDSKINILGYDAIFEEQSPELEGGLNEAFVRTAIKTKTREEAERVLNFLTMDGFWGPVGGIEPIKQIQPLMEVYSALISRDDVEMQTNYESPDRPGSSEEPAADEVTG